MPGTTPSRAERRRNSSNGWKTRSDRNVALRLGFGIAPPYRAAANFGTGKDGRTRPGMRRSRSEKPGTLPDEVGYQKANPSDAGGFERSPRDRPDGDHPRQGGRMFGPREACGRLPASLGRDRVTVESIYYH